MGSLEGHGQEQALQLPKLSEVQLLRVCLKGNMKMHKSPVHQVLRNHQPFLLILQFYPQISINFYPPTEAKESVPAIVTEEQAHNGLKYLLLHGSLKGHKTLTVGN